MQQEQIGSVFNTFTSVLLTVVGSGGGISVGFFDCGVSATLSLDSIGFSG